jgi:hypothetical protein
MSWIKSATESSPPKGALRPPAATAELVRNGCTFVTIATDAPARFAAIAARKPATPPPMIKTSKSGTLL